MRQYIDTLQDVQGNALVGATVLVQNYIGGANASIFSDNGLTPILTSTLTTGADGQFSFFAADGDYTLVMSKNATVFKTQSPVSIFDGTPQLTYADSGTTNAYAVTNSALEKALRAGLRISINASNTNTGASTFAYNGLAAKPLVNPPAVALSAGAVAVGGIYGLEYDGSNWQIKNVTLSAAVIGQLFYPQTAAEIAAAVVPVNYNIQSHLATNGILFPERYGNNTTPGTTPMSAIIQIAISVATAAGGGIVQLSDTNYFLGTTALTIPSNVTLRMVKGGQFTVNSSVPGSMPQAYLSITGSNVEIDGCLGFIAANPFTTYAAQGAFIGFGASNLSNIKIHDCDATWFMHGVFSSWFAATVANNLTNVVIERNRFTSFASDIFCTGLSPSNWTVRNNTNETISHTLSNNGGAIQILPGVNLANVDAFTQSAFDTGYGFKISVTGNSLKNSLDRPLRFMNCQQLEVADNNLTLALGSFFADSTHYSADAITFDLCRRFSCHDNTLVGGGENGIDLLSCQDYEVHDNIIKQANTAAAYVYLSDLWNASVTSPKLSSITTRSSLQNLNADIHDNYFEAFEDIYVGAGQNLKVHDNSFKLFKTSTNWISGQSPFLLALDINTASAYFTESAANWPHDIEFSGNKPVLVGPVSVTYNSGTGIFTTVGGVAHNFVTGDRIETVASGTSLTVDYPTGLDYKLDYYVINVSATTFKLATTSVLAFAGTNIVPSTNGLSVAGSALLVREQTWPAVINVSASYYSPAQNISLDERIGFVSTNLFSTLSSISASTAFFFKKFKMQFYYDPAVSNGNAKNTQDKWADLVNGVASNGTTVYGVSAFQATTGGYTFAIGAKPANIAGGPTDGYIKTSFW
jgi:hypothetical protein